MSDYTSPQVQQAAASTMPSRDFMVRQAVLNVLGNYLPETIRIYGSSAAARDLIGVMGQPDENSHWFYRETRSEFNALVAQYQGTIQ